MSAAGNGRFMCPCVSDGDAQRGGQSFLPMVTGPGGTPEHGTHVLAANQLCPDFNKSIRNK